MSDSQEVRVERIIEKLACVRDKGLKCFGSESHGFRLNRVLKESEIADFESTHGIRLPADYRVFLKYAGNGGAGPYYGIYPLAKWDDFACWMHDDPIPRFVALPCPLHPDIRREPDWEDEFDVESPYQGTISLGTQGCTYATQLVVSGPYAGRVVYVDADGQPPYMVRNVDFLEWYERWLDELLAGYDTSWFGFGLGGSEEYLLEIVNDSTAPETDRAEAAAAFCRLPRLSTAAQQCMLNLLSDSVEGVRANACRAIGSFEVPNVENATSVLLNDASSDVRQQAVIALMQLDATRWSKKVAERLRDDESEVASTAFIRLQDADELGRNELLEIVTESRHGNLRCFAAHAMQWKEEDEPLLIALLRDAESQVRFHAILGLHQLKSTASLPTVLNILDREKDDIVIGGILKMLGELGDAEARNTLLRWTTALDDFHRLDAVDGLCKLGDTRVALVASEMLREERPPKRMDSSGMMIQTHVDTIRTLVARSLECSPKRSLRKLARGGNWWPW